MAGDADGAIVHWLKALEIDPVQRLAIYNLGVVYLDKGDKAKARAYLTQYKNCIIGLYRPGKRPLSTRISKSAVDGAGRASPRGNKQRGLRRARFQW